jgi:indolepyruvate ferredoxin oxidoreductase
VPNVVALPKSLEERIAFREEHLRRHSGRRVARAYRATVDRIEEPRLREAVALGYHKLLAYKDEYEVARLLKETRAKAEAEFAGDLKLTYHLAPPVVSKEGPDGRPAKRRFGGWIERAYPVLASLKGLRGTPLDPFGRTEERRMERALIAEYEADLEAVLPVAERNLDAAVAWAEVPLSIRGFGPVKARHAAAAAKRREEALAALRMPPRAEAAE